MTWSLKTKTEQQVNVAYILTPDGNYILLGSSEDETLIYQEAFNNWNLKSITDNTENWNLKPKIES